jgi:hypothetical protein
MYGQQNFLFLETKYGKFEGGAMYSAASRMRKDTEMIARATGGATGDWWRYANYPVYDTTGMGEADANELALAYRPTFLLTPIFNKITYNN